MTSLNLSLILSFVVIKKLSLFNLKDENASTGKKRAHDQVEEESSKVNDEIEKVQIMLCNGSNPLS